ncbi:BREX-2 system phosphatase PglZ [Azospirillum halopraeferens]|uniref:BREX-2 system phosphatase PglZ n=1 Tax=Azospirillum halopraeferens TaxID=34010 RepID=UPI00041F6B74|nr:BREX-2 system phosphatase PglZ [Azospirillum halopraeferens]
MTVLAPTTAQIRAQVEAIVRHDPQVRALGIRSPTRQPWPDRLDCAGRAFDVVWCESPLAARQALCERDDGTGLVLLTGLGPDALGDDVVARLAKARLLTVEAWEMVREAFQARNIDPRIAGKPWLAELLLEHAHRGPYPPVPGGLLDADTAWANLLDRALGLPVARPDAEALLRWCIGDGALARFAALAPVARGGIAAWLSEAAGPAGGLVTACVENGFGADALPLGLVAGVVFGTGWLASELTAASVRLEPFVGGRRIPAEHGRAWAAAAARALRPLDGPVQRRLLERADALLVQIHADAFAASSTVLLAGFEARLAGFAEALAAALEAKAPADLRALEAAAGRVAGHDQAAVQKGRAERVAMALRLVRWLSLAPAEPASFADAVAAYTRDGAFVDRARLTLAGGDELAALSSAYAALAAALRTRREAWNERFAGMLRAWNAAPAAAWPLVPVERVLEEVVAPLAAAAPVLLLVMDGMSHAVFRELWTDLDAAGWRELWPSVDDGPASAVAMLPTVTVVSRASLLCGRPQRGGQSVEKAGLAEHPALRAVSKAGHPPVLYHKGELSEGGALAPAVREAVGTSARRVVAIVHNAIDDHLDGPEQVRQRWSLDDLHLLRPILHEARNAGRVVVLTADHGHLIEAGTHQVGEGEGDRWRRADGSAGSGELSFAKGRVLTPDGDAIAVLPWSECVRYAGRKNGYHGGATPQEVLAPLAVLWSSGDKPPVWTLAPPVQPEWWEALATPASVAASPPRPAPATPPSRKRATAQPTLFDGPAQSPRAAVAPDWIGWLLASPVYAAQKQLAGRGAAKDEDVRAILEALAQRGGKLSRTALAQRLGVAQVRVGSVIMAARRVLNVDQVQVLEVEEASGTVVLNRALLDTQFELKG